MYIAAPAATPAEPPTGQLKSWKRGVPEHGEFTMLRTSSTDGSASIDYSSKAGAPLWMSPDDDFDRVLGEASGAAAQARQAVAIFTAEPGHWQQLFVTPLFRTDATGAVQALTGLDELDASSITRGKHLLAVADADRAIDLRTAPVDASLLPPRARPGA